MLEGTDFLDCKHPARRLVHGGANNDVSAFADHFVDCILPHVDVERDFSLAAADLGRDISKVVRSVAVCGFYGGGDGGGGGGGGERRREPVDPCRWLSARVYYRVPKIAQLRSQFQFKFGMSMAGMAAGKYIHEMEASEPAVGETPRIELPYAKPTPKTAAKLSYARSNQ